MKKRSLHAVNEYFELIYDEVILLHIIRAKV